MDEDYFSDGDMPDEKSMSESHESEEHEGKTAVINSEICPGMEPGSILKLRIEEVHDGEYVVAYEPDEETEHEKSPSEKAEMPKGMGGGDGEMASMYE